MGTIFTTDRLVSDDSFWANWGKSLERMARPSQAAAEVHTRRFEPESVTVQSSPVADVVAPEVVSLDSTQVQPARQLVRVRLRPPPVAIRSVTFGVVNNTPPKPPIQANSRSNRSFDVHRKKDRVAPPKELPVRERLKSILQPPLENLLGDDPIMVPFEPFAYQYAGIQFLMGRWAAILADEMGLGKTMQTIMSLRLMLRSGQIRNALLVCPKPLVTNWLREFATWAEEIPVLAVSGDNWVRRNAWLHDRSPVKIANYESLSRDEDLFKDGLVDFDIVVLDEAQRIKNRDSKTARVAHCLKRNRSWALTGTPVENRAEDLISLLEFVHNKRNGIDERPDLLRDAVGDVLLRRTKEMVMQDMPPKFVNDVYIELSDAQRERYDAAEKEGVYELDDLGEEVTIEHVFELIRRLKQICNYDRKSGESSKCDRLRADMEEIAASGQKAILFSQWVSTIEWLEERLQDYNPLLYHGKIPHKHRDSILKEFKENPDRPLLMMSYATGAVGLNLQFSNYVFLYDRWWNPAIEDQAINRAHRIGQKAPVIVSRFLTPDTIESRIAEVLERKRELFAFLIDDREPDPAALGSQGLSRDDVFQLFNLVVKNKKAA